VNGNITLDFRSGKMTGIAVKRDLLGCKKQKREDGNTVYLISVLSFSSN